MKKELRIYYKDDGYLDSIFYYNNKKGDIILFAHTVGPLNKLVINLAE